MAAGILACQSVVLFIFMFIANWKTALAFLICSVLVYIYYIRRTSMQLGGITGDTEGWYLCIQEAVYMVAAVIVWHLSILFV